jgi:hypothetical protein
MSLYLEIIPPEKFFIEIPYRKILIRKTQLFRRVFAKKCTKHFYSYEI